MKGDLLNLQDAGVGLGVIVLAGTDVKDDGLRRFAEALVDRPGPTVLIWTADDVRALVAGQAHSNAVTMDPPASPDPRPASSPASTSQEAAASTAVSTHSGKYAALYRWLRTQDTNSLTMTFGEVEEILGFPLPNSCRQDAAHWHGYAGSAVARAIIAAGWKASRVRLTEESVTLLRPATG